MKSFRLRNIKGFLDTGNVEIKPITVIIGENSSGKSSIIRFPLVLRQTFLDASRAPLLFYGKSIDYGNYEDVVFNHDRTQPIQFAMSINGSELYEIGPFFLDDTIKKIKDETITVSVKISNCGRTIQVEHLSIIIDSDNNRPLLEIKNNANKNIMEMLCSNNIIFQLPKEEINFDKFIPDFRFMRSYRKLSNDIKTRSFNYAYELFSLLSYYFNNVVSNFFYIGPFRKTPERYYRYTENSVNYVGQYGEFAPVILGQDLRSNGKLVKDVSDWLEKYLRLALEVEDLKGDLFRIIIRDLKTNAKNNLIDVGHGLSQLIPIIVQSFMKTDLNDTILRASRYPISNLHIIEQPELHLHPAAQASLADLFVEVVKNNKRLRKNSFLIETHSEHMLLRLRRYIAEGKISSDDIALYYTEKDMQNGSLIVSQLEILSDGNILNWPKGFFSQDYFETLAMKKAQASKMDRGDSTLW